MRTQLYKHYDAEGALLYVGISLSAVHRLAQHKKASWFNRISEVKVENFPSRTEALIAEEIAIKTEKPLHNILHNSAHARPVTNAEASSLVGMCISFSDENSIDDDVYRNDEKRFYYEWALCGEIMDVIGGTALVDVPGPDDDSSGILKPIPVVDLLSGRFIIFDNLKSYAKYRGDLYERHP